MPRRAEITPRVLPADALHASTLVSQVINRVMVGGKKYDVQIVLKDSQSNPNRAGEVANDLILKDKVALVLTAGTPETANPVSDACELNAFRTRIVSCWNRSRIESLPT